MFAKRSKIKYRCGMTHISFPHPTWIEIDLKQFKTNISIIRNFVGNSLYCLPVKANAYGHGLCAIGKAAEEAGVDYLAVAHLQEGIQLREANVRLPILVLGAIHEDQILDLINFNLEFTISSQYKADLVAEKCKKIRQKCLVHLEVDTGMQRTGVRTTTAISLFQYLKQFSCFDIKGVYSHLSNADDPFDAFTIQQIDAFNALLKDPVFYNHSFVKHIANSGGTAHFPSAHLDMVRPSMLSFGYIPDNVPQPLKAITSCFSLKTKVSYFKVVEKDTGIGYNHTYKTDRQTRIVTVPIGYGDGYRRSLSNRGMVLIRGKRFPIVGRICMDQCMVDIGNDEIHVGDEVVLIGKQGDQEISVHEIANLCGTIPNEVVCFFNDRLPRVYV